MCFLRNSLSMDVPHPLGLHVDLSRSKRFPRTPNFILLFMTDLFSSGYPGYLLPRTGFLQLQRAGATLHWGAQASHGGDFSRCRVNAPGLGLQ